MNTDYFLFGLEFEFYLKDENDKTHFINELNKKLNVKLLDLTSTYYAENPEEWILSIEKTMPILGNKNGYELTSPILYFDELKHTINIVLEILQEYCFTNESCGFHFHISAESEDLVEPDIIKFLLLLNENKVFNDYRIRNEFVLNIMDVLKNTNLDIFKKFYKCLGKYYNVYFVDLDQKHIEIRILGDENYEYNENISDFIYSVSKYFYFSMTEDENEKYVILLEEFKKENSSNQTILYKDDLEMLAIKHELTFDEMFKKAKRTRILNTEGRLPND
ncbi:amidoligase family protein [Arcobacter cloacae]|uniref:Amidoligase n=1 Tax=Arcobacter cloacae TaxID=1054034 RepID=A0A4Q0ZQP0_9BACT|nr:amidoligase family protein [Arcobacter cloacae]RXJ85908.1 hypothetical protein CRU90_01205 [Arcobacter cloacae]